jgi:hypothetical protein
VPGDARSDNGEPGSDGRDGCEKPRPVTQPDCDDRGEDGRADRPSSRQRRTDRRAGPRPQGDERQPGQGVTSGASSA